MIRSPLDDKANPLKLSGHETFPLRYGWLKKAYDAVAQDENGSDGPTVFQADDAIARFGVGRNMVSSMRHWSTVANIISTDGRDTTPVGRFVFGENGIDPYMEDPVTSWLVHWTICSDWHNTTWYWAFSHYPALLFDRNALIRGIEKLAKSRPGSRASISTIRNDVACFIRSYVSLPPSERTGYEDSLESPLTELGLIRPVGLRDGFQFVRGRKPTLGVGMVTYAVFEFWRSHSNAQTISFEALAHAPGSPGRVFGLDENTLADYLMEIDEASDGLCRWSETAGLKQLILDDDEIIRDKEENDERRRAILKRDYGRRLRRMAA